MYMQYLDYLYILQGKNAKLWQKFLSRQLQTKHFYDWRGLVDRKLVEAPPVIFIAGRPKAALLLWFFGDFRCGALLFVVIHVIYKYKNR